MKKSLGSKDIVFPTPVFIVGTYDESGTPNAMNVAWGGICSSNPPCVAISIRKNRRTYENILKTKAFTVNIPCEAQVAQADYFGLISGNKADKFEITGLTPVKSGVVEAPVIKEFPFNLECKVVNMMEIGQHVQIIGEIVNVLTEDDCLDEKGLPDILKLKPMLFDASGYNYYGVGDHIEAAFSVGKKFLKEE